MFQFLYVLFLQNHQNQHYRQHHLQYYLYQ